jgi:tetratricopeptide (TPR) repeat protein
MGHRARQGYAYIISDRRVYMEESDFLKRVSDLEQEVKALKAQIADAKQGGRLRACTRFLIANWVLISVLSAGLVAVYVKYRFGVDYFESYEKISDTKKLAHFYEQMGDRMMAKSEWPAAEQSYRAALQLDPNSTAATFGIVKAQVFQPLPGQKYFAPEVVDARLDYLISRFPDDYQIYFLKAVRYQTMGENDQAEGWFRKCISRNPSFIGCYLQLGVLNILQSQIAEAATNFAKVVELDPSSAAARNDLAVCHILQSDFSGAIQQFEGSYRISPTIVTSMSLGEAYWYNRQFSDALVMHRWAADYMNGTSDPQDRLLGGQWFSNYLPLHRGDLDTIKTKVIVNTLEQKKAFAHYELAIDQALLGNRDAADQEFAAALKLERGPEYRRLVQNRMQSVENLVPMSPETKVWLTEHHNLLD